MASCSHFSKEATMGAGAFFLAAEAGMAKLTAKTAAIATVVKRIISSLFYLSPPRRGICQTT